MPIYFGRLRLRNLTSPPPPFRTKRTSKARKKGAWNRLLKYYFGWIPHILLVDDRTLIATAGLDAFAFLRVCQFGLQLFVPLAVFAMIILLPVHVHGNDLELQHASFVASNVNVTAERPMGLLLTTVANIEVEERGALVARASDCGWWFYTRHGYSDNIVRRSCCLGRCT